MDKILRLAKTLSYSLAKPNLTEQELLDECFSTRQHRIGSITVLPCFVEDAYAYLKQTGIKVCAKIGTGSNTTAIKVYETEEACRNGAKEIELEINSGKLLSHNLTYIQQEIAVIIAITNYYKSNLTVSINHDIIDDEQIKIELYQLCNNLKVYAIKIPTRINNIYIDDDYWDGGTILDDLILVGSNTSKEVKIVAEGNIKTANHVLQLLELGIARVNTNQPGLILADLKKHFSLLTK